jgi:hypothetical protein
MTNRVEFRRSTALACVYALLLPLGAPIAAFGKGPKDLSWENVKKLSTGSSVTVTLKNNERYVGKVNGEVTDLLPLKTRAAAMSLAKENIKTIMTFKSKWANPGLYIMGGGMAAGAAIGLGGTLKDVNSLQNGQLTKGNSGQKGMVVGLIIGVGGLAVYLLAGKPRTIYEADQSAAAPVK